MDPVQIRLTQTNPGRSFSPMTAFVPSGRGSDGLLADVLLHGAVPPLCRLLHPAASPWHSPGGRLRAYSLGNPRKPSAKHRR